MLVYMKKGLEDKILEREMFCQFSQVTLNVFLSGLLGFFTAMRCLYEIATNFKKSDMDYISFQINFCGF